MSKLDDLRALREAKLERRSSDGGVEGHAGHRERAAEPMGPRMHKAVQLRPIRTDTLTEPEAGIKPGPSETRRGRPRLGEIREQPWIAAGMSRRTWYRRKAEARK